MDRPDPAGVTILVVDDSPVDQEAVQRAFSKQRIVNPLVFAADGQEALDRLRNHAVDRPYIVLLDLNMPRMTGHEFLEEVRGEPDLKNAVVFVFTTSSREQDLAKSYDLNVAGYVRKDRTGPDLLPLTQLLQRYLKIVELPG